MEDKQTAAQEVEDYWEDLFVASDSSPFHKERVQTETPVFNIFLLIGKYEEIHTQVFC